MTTCPHCNKPLTEHSPSPSNAERNLTLTIPEHHWMIFKMLFDQMNIKFGMMGLGEFANLLPQYKNEIPLDPQKFRYFNDTMMAYLFLGLKNGWKLQTSIEPGGTRDYEGNDRMKVIATLTKNNEKPITLPISEGVLEPIAKDVCAYLDDAAQRYTSME